MTAETPRERHRRAKSRCAFDGDTAIGWHWGWLVCEECAEKINTLAPPLPCTGVAFCLPRACCGRRCMETENLTLDLQIEACRLLLVTGRWTPSARAGLALEAVGHRGPLLARAWHESISESIGTTPEQSARDWRYLATSRGVTP